MTPPAGLQNLSLTLCTESFWPRFDRYSWWASDFCRTIDQSLNLKVLTWRGPREVPHKFSWAGFQVRRFPVRSGSPFSWLSNHNPWKSGITEEPGVLLLNLNLENTLRAHSIAGTANVPMLIRVNHEWLIGARARRKAKQFVEQTCCENRNVHFIFPDHDAAKHFEISDPRKYATIFDGVSISKSNHSTDSQRHAIRKHLAQAHPVFHVESGQTLFLWMGWLHEDTPVVHLVRAWNLVRRRWPKARLWIIGAGPGDHEVWKEICRRELQLEVVMPGGTDTPADWCRAANALLTFDDPFSEPQRFSNLARSVGTTVFRERVSGKPLAPATANQPGVIEFTSRDTEKLASRIIDFIADEANAEGELPPSPVAEIPQFSQTVIRYLEHISQLVEPTGRLH